VHFRLEHRVFKSNYLEINSMALSLLKNPLDAQVLRNIQKFMESKCLLPCSQGHVIGPHPEPYQSSSYRPILSMRYFLILSTHTHIGFLTGLLLLLLLLTEAGKAQSV
jgi:hypothetical protein